MSSAAARYLASTADGHIGREIEGAEREGLEGFFSGAPIRPGGEYASGWTRGQCVAFAQGALAYALHRAKGLPAETLPDCPYGQFSGPWESWCDGFSACAADGL